MKVRSCKLLPLYGGLSAEFESVKMLSVCLESEEIVSSDL